MKKVIPIILLMLGCQSNESLITTQQYNKSVGDEIDFSVAQKWIERYQGSTSARISQSNISSQSLSLLLNKEYNGIAFHHAQDNNGAHHTLAIPIDNALNWDKDNVIIDANDNTVLDKVTAKAWAKQWKDAHQGEIPGHFFGVEILKEIKSLPGFKEFEIVPALNDELKPQLILIVWDIMTVERQAAQWAQEKRMMPPTLAVNKFVNDSY